MLPPRAGLRLDLEPGDLLSVIVEGGEARIACFDARGGDAAPALGLVADVYSPGPHIAIDHTHS